MPAIKLMPCQAASLMAYAPNVPFQDGCPMDMSRNGTGGLGPPWCPTIGHAQRDMSKSGAPGWLGKKCLAAGLRYGALC